jgi:hypothetical protein
MMLSIFFNFQCLQRTLSKSTLKILAYVFCLCLMQYLFSVVWGKHASWWAMLLTHFQENTYQQCKISLLFFKEKRKHPLFKFNCSFCTLRMSQFSTCKTIISDNSYMYTNSLFPIYIYKYNLYTCLLLILKSCKLI